MASSSKDAYIDVPIPVPRSTIPQVAQQSTDTPANPESQSVHTTSSNIHKDAPALPPPPPPPTDLWRGTLIYFVVGSILI